MLISLDSYSLLLRLRIAAEKSHQMLDRILLNAGLHVSRTEAKRSNAGLGFASIVLMTGF